MTHDAMSDRFARTLAGLGVAHMAAIAILNDSSLNNELVRTWSIICGQFDELLDEVRTTIEAMEGA